MPDEVKAASDIALRDYETPGLPASGPHEVIKSEHRGVMNIVNDKLNVLEGSLGSGRIGAPTYAALAAIVDQPSGTIGEVAVDAGTHVDPVVGGPAVANSGVYVYSTAPAGWRRVDNYRALDIASQAEVDAGVNDAKAVTPAKMRAAKTDRQLDVWIEYVSGPDHDQVWRPITPAIILSGDPAKYEFHGIMHVNTLSGLSIAITQYDGTPFFGSVVRAPDGLSGVGVNGIKKGERFVMRRNHVPLATGEIGTAGVLRLLKAPGFGIDKILPTAHAIDTFGMPVTVDRPLSMRQVENNLYVLDMKLLWPDHYDGAVGYNHSDIFRASLLDMRNFQANVPDGALCLNSFFARVGYRDVPITNLQFWSLDGITTDVGGNPSTFEPPFFAGDNADATTGPGTDTNFAPRGIGHGYEVQTTVSLIGTLEGVDTANLYGSGDFVKFNGDKVTMTLAGFITTTAGEILGAFENIVTAEPTADSHVRVQVSYDFADSIAEVEPATTGPGTYCMPVPIANCDRIVGFLNGVRVTGVGASVNGIHIIDKKDTTVTSLGIIDAAIAWNSDLPEVQTFITNNIGPGKSCRINGVAQNATIASGVQNNAWGSKLLGTPVYALGTAKHVLTDETYEFDYSVCVKRAEPIV